MHIANYWPVYSWPENYWPDWPPQDIEPDGLAVGLAYGAVVVFQPGEVQGIAPDGYAVALGLGEPVVTRRGSVVIPLYEIAAESRLYRARAESRVYEVEV